MVKLKNMSAERIDYNNLTDDIRYRNFSSRETSTHNDTTVDIRKLIELTERHPVEQKPVSEFLHELDYDCWDDTNENRISPKHVVDVILNEGLTDAKLNHPEIADHIKRIEKADISYPIHVYDGHIMNVMHRLCAIVLATEIGKHNQNFVVVKVLQSIPEEALVESRVEGQSPTPSQHN